MSEVPLVSVVILSFRGRKLLEQFTPSILQQDYPRLEVMVVVTGSEDGSAEWIEQTYPSWRVIRNAANHGPTEDCNIGARAARGEFIYWLGNDMWLEPDCISRLVGKMRADPSIGICTSKFRRITPELQKLNLLDHVGGNVDFMGFPLPIGHDEEDVGAHDATDEIFFSYGTGMMIRRDAFERAGGYDSAFFSQVDDTDLSWRVRLLGFRVCAEPASVLYHRSSATLSSRSRGEMRFWSERNTVRMLLKNYSAISLLWVLPCWGACLFLEILFYLGIRRPDIAAGVVKAVRWNASNLKGTLELRKRVQASRRVSDRAILALMHGFPGKIREGLSFLKHRNSPQWKAFFSR